MFSRRLAALGAFFVVGLAVAACGSGVPGNSVADVAGNPITLRAWHHWLYVAAKSQAANSPGQPVILPSDPPKFPKCITEIKAGIPTLAKAPNAQLLKDCKTLFTQESGEVMDFLIKADWYQAEALKEGIHVTNAQVMKTFNNAKKTQFHTAAEFNSFLSSTGETLQDVLFRFRINQVSQDLLKKLTPKVTPQQISAYYNSHLSQYGTPETRDIRIVLTKSKSQALAAKSALMHHQSWTTVAKKYSTDSTTKNRGGLLTGVRKGQEDHALDAASFAAPLNKLLGPVKGSFGYYVFEVTKITKATQQTLAQATPSIQSSLKTTAQTTAQTKLQALVKKAWLSKTTCVSTYAMADCSNKPSSGTGTSSSPSTPPPSSTTGTTSK